MDVVDKIGASPTGTRDGMENVPVTPIVIKSVTEKRAAAGAERQR
jgi:hypothetical protein